MTRSHLSQKNLQNDDFVVLKYENFERLIIFDRQEHEYTGDDQENFNKKMFLKFLYLLMTIVVHIDENAQGHFAIVTSEKKPK